MRYAIILILCMVLLLSGCGAIQVDYTEKLCSMAKNLPEVQESDLKVFYEGGICFMQDTNITNNTATYFIECNNWRYRMSLMITAERNDTVVDEFDIKGCKLAKIGT